MSSKVNEKKVHSIETDIKATTFEEPFQIILSRVVKSFPEVLRIKSRPDIYTRAKNIPFQERHPIFKGLMKLEFQDSLLK